MTSRHIPKEQRKSHRKKCANDTGVTGLVDGLGRPVPPRLFDEFWYRERMLDAHARLQAWRASVMQNTKRTWPLWHSTKFTLLFESLAEEFWERLPFVPCIVCKADGSLCNACEGNGFLTEPQWLELCQRDLDERKRQSAATAERLGSPESGQG